MIKLSLLCLRLLLVFKYTLLIALPLTKKRDFALLSYKYFLGPRQASVLATNPLKVTCFNYSEVRHFASSCLNPYTTFKINEIKQENEETFVNNKANNDKDNANSKLEN